MSDIEVIATIRPKNSGSFAIVEDSDFLGGYRAVADSTARMAIPSIRRKHGMMVYQQDDGKHYILDSDLTTWAVYTGGGASGTANTVAYFDASGSLTGDASIQFESGRLGIGQAPDPNAPLAVLGHSRYLMTLFTDEALTSHAEWFIGYAASNNDCLAFDFNRASGAGSPNNFCSMHIYGDVAGNALSLHPGGKVGIGTPGQVDASAKLQVESTSSGILIPRMTSAQRNSVASPAVGLLIFDTSLGRIVQFNGSAWEEV